MGEKTETKRLDLGIDRFFVYPVDWDPGSDRTREREAGRRGVI